MRNNSTHHTCNLKLHCEPRHHIWSSPEPEQLKQYKTIKHTKQASQPYFQDELVDESRSDTAEDGTHPVDPVIGPGIEDDGRSEGPGRVHAGAGEGDGEEVAGGDGQPDGEGGRTFHTLRVVSVSSGREDDENQDQGDDELNTEPLASIDVGESTGSRLSGDENTENSRSDNGSDTLSHHVEQTFHQPDLLTENKGPELA